MTHEEFIKKAHDVHGDEYIYDKTFFVKTTSKVCITCRKHGDFWILPHNHLAGHKCVACSNERMSKKFMTSQDDFINECKQALGDRYTYNHVVYRGRKKKVAITCPKHGDFWKFPCEISKKRGCPKCNAEERFKRNKAAFFKFANEHFGDKYDFDKANYVNSQTKIKVVCKKHGSFWIKPNSLTCGIGCRQCWEERRGKSLFSTTDDFKEKAWAKHGDLYDYSLVDYRGKEIPVKIICGRHGLFNQKPSNHLAGNGCPTCSNSKGELRIVNFLKNNNILFQTQKRIKSDNIFYQASFFVVDFYIPRLSLIIEYHGEQHYMPIKHFGGRKKFERQQDRDMALRQYCKENGIRLLEIPYWDYENIETILKQNLKKA